MMDQKLIGMLTASIEGVFSTMLGSEIECGAPYEDSTTEPPHPGLTGLIGMAGAWIGSVSISCDASVGCKVASLMLGMEFSEVGEEVLDALSEITNMIAGNFKTEVEPSLGPLGLSIPTVVFGLHYTARTPGKEKWVVIPCASGGEKIVVKICLAPNRGLPKKLLPDTALMSQS
jgi:chemotaxis protein CheX